MSDYRNLMVWKKSMDLVKEVYGLAKKLPPEEKYALSDQLRRAVVSVPSNIAEGSGRDSEKEYVRFLNIAKGSACEVETQLTVCCSIGYLDQGDIEAVLALCTEVEKMLSSLAKKISSRKN